MTFSAAAPALLLVGLILIALVLLGGVAVRALSRLDLRRSVLLHAPTDQAWDLVHHLPALYARHGKARDRAINVEDWTLLEGDGEGAGSTWRGRGDRGGAPFWLEMQIARRVPGVELAIRLLRDSLGTHRGLRHHRATLTLRAVDAGTTKLTWRLQARLRGLRMLCLRLFANHELNARLLDQGLRSIKRTVEAAARDRHGTAWIESAPIPEPGPPGRRADQVARANPGESSSRRPPTEPPPEATT